MAAPDPVLQDRIYRAISADLARGAIKHGARLEAPALSERYGASVTPVREALYRLVGEGHIGLHQGGGFHVPALGLEAVRSLYDCNLRFLLASLSPSPSAPCDVGAIADGGAYVERTARLFGGLADRAGNTDWRGFMDILNQRLAPLRHAEWRILPGAADDLTRLEASAVLHHEAVLRAQLRRYHRRRAARAPELYAQVMGDAAR